MTPERSDHLRLELELLDGEQRSPARSRDIERGHPAILVLGPDPDLRAYIVRCVEEDRGSGGVVEAATAAEAIRVLARRGVVLLIAEADGPGAHQSDLCRLAREAAANPALPIVLVLDEPIRQGDPSALETDTASRIVTKPFNRTTLGDAVRDMLDIGPPPPESPS